jgi:Chemotaxis response regulator containing a CheY-like receiver domain and a methylesterase domain
MNRVTPLQVYEAEDGQPVLPGHAYIAPGDRHLLVDCKGAGYRCRLHDGPQVNRHKPSVDVLFRSVAHCAGDSAIGVILTGMGDDGARCLLEMRELGARTLAQDEASSVVWGMPGMAVKLGAAERVLPLREIPSALVALLPNNDRRAAGKPHLAAGRLFS